MQAHVCDIREVQAFQTPEKKMLKKGLMLCRGIEVLRFGILEGAIMQDPDCTTKTPKLVPSLTHTSNKFPS